MTFTPWVQSTVKTIGVQVDLVNDDEINQLTQSAAPAGPFDKYIINVVCSPCS